MDTLFTFWDDITHYKAKTVHFWGLMNSATKVIGLLNHREFVVMLFALCPIGMFLGSPSPKSPKAPNCFSSQARRCRKEGVGSSRADRRGFIGLRVLGFREKGP